MFKKSVLITGVMAIGLMSASTWAAATVVTSFDATLVAPGQWFTNDVRNNGTASIVDLTGLGGNLENNAPLPTGAAKLTTGFDNADKAEVAVQDNYGKVSDIFSSLRLSYDYYKATVAGGNAFAAPSLKLSFFNPASTGAGVPNRGFVTLVYEPTWNQVGSAGSSVAVPTDQWTTVNIDQNKGLFWATGGFGAPNTAGGPPLRTLAEWTSAFNSEFADATLFQVSIGVGSYNQGQEGYFDNVGISHSSFAQSYDFQVAKVVPVPAAAWMGLSLLGGLGLVRGMKSRVLS